MLKHSIAVRRWLIFLVRCISLETSREPSLGRNGGECEHPLVLAALWPLLRIPVCRQEPGGSQLRRRVGPEGSFWPAVGDFQWHCLLCELTGVIKPGPEPALAPSFLSMSPIATYNPLPPNLVPILYPSSSAHPKKTSWAMRTNEAQAGQERWQHVGTGYLQMADWLYAGPSVALRACPTWVWVRPRDRRRILKALANSRISSRLTPSTSPAAVWGSVEMFLKIGSIRQHTSK